MVWHSSRTAHERHPHKGYLNRRNVVHLAVQSRAQDAAACGPVGRGLFAAPRKALARATGSTPPYRCQYLLEGVTPAAPYVPNAAPAAAHALHSQRPQRVARRTPGRRRRLTIAPTPAMLDALLRPSPFPPSAESPGRCTAVQVLISRMVLGSTHKHTCDVRAVFVSFMHPDYITRGSVGPRASAVELWKWSCRY